MAAQGAAAFPEGYEPADVWQPSDLGGSLPPPFLSGRSSRSSSSTGPMGSMNRPTAGPRFEASLPVGDHSLQLYSLGTPNGMKVSR